MAKNSKEQQIEDERKILAELQKNSYKDIDTIAKHCGFSTQKVRRCIKQLEKSHKIWGYTSVIDTEKQDLQKFLLLLKRSKQPIQTKTADGISQGRYEKSYTKLGITIQSGYYLHGQYDWAVIFTAQSIKEAKKFSQVIMELYPDIVEKINLSQILFTQREHNILNPEPTKLHTFL